jgi:hypothetical protein
MGAAGSAGTSRALLMARRPSWVKLDQKARSCSSIPAGSCASYSRKWTRLPVMVAFTRALAARYSGWS